MTRKSHMLSGLTTILLLMGMVSTVAAGPARGRIVVANRASGNLTVIDTKNDMAETVAMPAGDNTPDPMYVVFSPTHHRVFVGDRANNRVVVFNASDLSVEGEVPTGNGVFHMWASSMIGQLWVNNDIDNTITVIDTITLEVITTIPLPADLVGQNGKPHDVILDPVAPFAYVTMVGFGGPDDYVVKFSADTFLEVDRATVGKDPHVSLNRGNGLLYVPCQNSSAVFVLQRDTLDPLPSIAFDGAHGAGMTRNGKILYSTNLPNGGIDGLFAIDTATNTVVGKSDTPFTVPHNVALTPNGKKIYVTHSGGAADKVTVYTVSNKDPNPTFLTDVTTGLNPFGLAFVP